MGASKNMI